MLGFKPTEFLEGLKATYRDYLKKHGSPRPDFSFEDELLARIPAQMRNSRPA